MEWDPFLGVIADKLSVERSDLILSSLEWHWLKPASSPWLPIQDEPGFLSMLKKVKSKPEPYVIIHMQAPIKKGGAAGSRAGSSGNALSIFDDPESDFEDGPVGKKVHKIISRSYLLYSILAGKAGRRA